MLAAPAREPCSACGGVPGMAKSSPKAEMWEGRPEAIGRSLDNGESSACNNLAYCKMFQR